MAVMTEIDKLSRHAKRVANGHERVHPGMPAAFTEACQAGDGIWQGDLGLEIVDRVPDDYVRIEAPIEADKQLVPGNTQGARHCLDSLDGVSLYRPRIWSEETLRGPCFVTSEQRRVLHPIHGAVTVPAGFTVLCRYQRDYDKELRRERRACD